MAPAGYKSASQQPSCQVCHLRVQPCMVWSARGTASPNSSSAKSYPGSKRPEFSFSLYKKVQSVQKISLGAESLIFIHLFHLFLGESFSNTLRCQTWDEYFAAMPHAQMKKRQPSPEIILSEMSSNEKLVLFFFIVGSN